MAISHQRTVEEQEALQKRWQERCRTGNFSAAVLGVGTVRVFGKSGDAPVTFPRIETMAVQDQLEEDERWAIEMAHDLVTSARSRRRTVVSVQPPRAGMAPIPTPVQYFDPKTENLLILSMTQGG